MKPTIKLYSIKNFNLFIILSTVILLLTSSMCLGTTYYVDATNGNDSNNGLSEIVAWKTISKLNNSIFQPGDNIFLKRGETWREQLNISSSGSEGIPITIGTYGTGINATINGSNSVRAVSISSQYLTFDGITFINGKDDTMFFLDGREITIKNCIIQNSNQGDGIQIWTNSNSISDITIKNNVFSNFSGGHAVNLSADGQNISNITFTNNTVSTVKNLDKSAILIFPYNGGSLSGDINITDNTIFDIGGPAINIGADDLTPGVSPDKVFIARNNINKWMDAAGSSDDGGIHIVMGTGGTWIIEKNKIYNGEGDWMGAGIYIDTFIGGAVTVRYNYVYNNNAIGLRVLNADNVEFYYNIVENNGKYDNNSIYRSAGIAIHSMGSGVHSNNTKIYNNTVWLGDDSKKSYGIEIQNLGMGHIEGTVIKNNIIYHDAYAGYGPINNVSDVTAEIDYNLYYPPVSNKEMRWLADLYNSFHEWQFGTSQDLHSLQADPKLEDLQNENFKLRSNSSCINAGIDIGLNYDYLGNSIIGVPDIGAYEWEPVKSSNLLSPPHILRIEVN